MDSSKRHVVCFSGGESSARVAEAVVRRYGPENVFLVNHDINANVEDRDIKRFKKQVSDYLGVGITYVNYKGLSEPPDQFDVCLDNRAFKIGHDKVLCTSRLKTEPFMAWLHSNFPRKDAIVYYGFDKKEFSRIQRRSSIMGAHGFRTEFPIAHWDDVVPTTKNFGVEPPLVYGVWKHANCVGCIKGRKQHWFAVYVHRRDIWEKAKNTEDALGYSIQSDVYLEELEPLFEEMVSAGVEATEKVNHARFWVDAKKLVRTAKLRDLAGVCSSEDNSQTPCECTD